MITIAISDFRAHLQEYLGYISRGEEIVITLRGKEIAKIIPPENKIDSARKRLKELAKTAVIKNVTDPISVDWKLST
ncbi:hypothetical protein ES708_26666 [subsurface metagenome]